MIQCKDSDILKKSFSLKVEQNLPQQIILVTVA